jgi:hypothetical protein
LADFNNDNTSCSTQVFLATKLQLHASTSIDVDAPLGANPSSPPLVAIPDSEVTGSNPHAPTRLLVRVLLHAAMHSRPGRKSGAERWRRRRGGAHVMHLGTGQLFSHATMQLQKQACAELGGMRAVLLQ